MGMRISSFFVGLVVTIILAGSPASYGLATSEVGPDSVRGHPTTEQTDWPKGIVDLARLESRVFSYWINGNENFYFDADAAGIAELIQLFSKARLRDHELVIRTGKPEALPFDEKDIRYNVHLHVLGGIALGATREAEEPKTYAPVLTIYVDPDRDRPMLEKLKLPDNVILTGDIDSLPVKGKATRPERRTWHAGLQFDDGTPAVDFENSVNTRITYWEKGNERGIPLGHVSYKGQFHAPFSAGEIADLESGKAWLTITVGNWSTALMPDHPRLKAADLFVQKEKVQAIKVGRPGYYYGRILFDDDGAAVLDPKPWPGAEIHINFSCVGRVVPDDEGYFKVHFSEEQIEKMRAKKSRKNIYIPNPDKRGRSTARFAFPASKLAKSKTEAGVVKIPRPTPK